jgi:glycolate oxidase iron-sulfur subunit
MTTCAAKVDFMHLADIGRSYIERYYRRPLGDRLLRALLAHVLTRTRRFRMAVRLVRWARPLRGALPRRLRPLLALAPRSLPAAREAVPPSVYPAEGERRLRVSLLTGCVQQALAPRINAATIRLLNRHGCEVVVAAGAACCGALPLHMGKEEHAKALARQTIAAWERVRGAGGLDAVVINASGCGTVVKDYAKLFKHAVNTAAAAHEIGKRALDVSELLLRIGLKKPDKMIPLAVAYHDACSLQHAQKVIEPPRALLRGAGFQVLDVPERHFCCGSAGTYNMLQPELAEQLGRRKAAHIESTGAAVIAAGNLGCMTQVGLYSAKPIVHTVELLDWATGGPLPPGLAGLTLPAPIKDEAPAAADANAIW